MKPVVHKEYEVIPTTGAGDPCGVAIAEHMVGQHAPEVRRRIGAWRWPLMARHRDVILPLLKDAKLAIDFGGSAGPVGYGCVIVDRIAEYRSLCELPPVHVDVMVSSHTFEHVVNIWLCMAEIQVVLRPGGVLVAHVPSWRAVNLRADRWAAHAHTFRLEGDDCDCEALSLDRVIENSGLTVTLTDADERNLIIFAEKRP